jgi:hypothetical protein
MCVRVCLLAAARATREAPGRGSAILCNGRIQGAAIQGCSDACGQIDSTDHSARSVR